MKPPLITCPTCHGKGQSQLDTALTETLARLSKAKKPLSTLDLETPGVVLTAIANRLVILERHGLAKRVGKQGRSILWTATPTSK